LAPAQPVATIANEKSDESRIVLEADEFINFSWKIADLNFIGSQRSDLRSSAEPSGIDTLTRKYRAPSRADIVLWYNTNARNGGLSL
jgi:hypothetical protein